MPKRFACLGLVLFACPVWAHNGYVRALSDPFGAAAGQPAAATAEGSAGVRASWWHGGDDLGSLEGVLPLGARNNLSLRYAKSEPWDAWTHNLNVASTLRLYSGTWVGGRAELWKGRDEEEMDFSLGAIYRPNAHLALAWDARHLLGTVTVAPRAESQRTFGLGGAIFVDRQENVVLHGEASLPSSVSSVRTDFYALAGMRLRLGDTVSATLSLGADTRRDSLAAPRALDAYWNLAIGFPAGVHRVELLAGGESYRLRGDKRDPVLHVGIAFLYDAWRDREPPLAYAELDSAGVFHLHAEDNSGSLLDWQFLVHRASAEFVVGPMVHRYAGSGAPPDTLAFTATDMRGEKLPGGRYAYRLLVRDKAGNGQWSAWRYTEQP